MEAMAGICVSDAGRQGPRLEAGTVGRVAGRRQSRIMLLSNERGPGTLASLPHEPKRPGPTSPSSRFWKSVFLKVRIGLYLRHHADVTEDLAVGTFTALRELHGSVCHHRSDHHLCGIDRRRWWFGSLGGHGISLRLGDASGPCPARHTGGVLTQRLVDITGRCDDLARVKEASKRRPNALRASTPLLRVVGMTQPNAALQAVRAALHMSQDELARAVRAAGD